MVFLFRDSAVLPLDRQNTNGCSVTVVEKSDRTGQTVYWPGCDCGYGSSPLRSHSPEQKKNRKILFFPGIPRPGHGDEVDPAGVRGQEVVNFFVGFVGLPQT